MLYILSFASYGFEVLGVREISAKKNSNDEYGIANYFAASILTRISIFLALTIPLIVFTIFYQGGRFFELSLIWSLHPLGVLLQSNFYFQALNKNKYFSILLVTTRIISLAIAYFYIQPGDVLLASACISGSFFLSGVIACGHILISHAAYINAKDSLRNCIHQYKQGLHLASGNTFVAMFRGSNVLILSAFSSASEVMIYSLAEKIIKVVQAASMPLNMHYQNKVNNWFDHAKTRPTTNALKKKIWEFTRIQLWIIFSMIAASLIALITYRKTDGTFLVSPDQLSITSFMSIAIFLGICNYMFGAIGLTLLGRERNFAKYVFISGMASIVLSMLSAKFLGIFGVATAYVLGEAILFTLCIRAFSIFKNN